MSMFIYFEDGLRRRLKKLYKYNGEWIWLGIEIDFKYILVFGKVLLRLEIMYLSWF